MNFAACFVENIQGYSCDPQLLLLGLEIANQNDNIFVSAEPLWLISAPQMKKLATYLSHWDEVIVIVYYRRFYDWIGSFYNQIVKSRTLSDEELVRGIEFLKELIRSYHDKYVIDFVTSLSKTFRDIRVMNYHIQLDVVESFYCQALPNAKNSCAAYLNEEKHSRVNIAKPLCYTDLVYAAKKMVW